jgi:tetratricopeptide (TPR) repeat protein
MMSTSENSQKSENSLSPAYRFVEWNGGEAVERLKSEISNGNLAGLREYLRASREQEDWQDRVFVLTKVVPELRVQVLDFIAEGEPVAADLMLIRCAYYTERAKEMRGSGTSDEVQKGGFEAAAECVRAALAALEKSLELDPLDPTASTYVMPAFMIFGELASQLQGCFARVTHLAAHLVPAHRTMVNALAKRWYGSHEKSIEFARAALHNAPPGSDMAYCLFFAHNLVRTHFSNFDQDEKSAREYFNKADVREELAAAFDRWIAPPYVPSRSSVAYLHLAAWWFYFVRDQDRLKRAFELIDGRFLPDTWGLSRDRYDIFENALDFASGIAPEERYRADPLGECMKKIIAAENCRKKGAWTDAGEASIASVAIAGYASPELAPSLMAAGLLNMHFFMKKMGAGERARQALDQAKQRLDVCQVDEVPPVVAHSIAKSLAELAENRRAIPFCEHTIRTCEEVDPLMLTEMLLALGQAYLSIGLSDHAAVPLRACLKMFRSYPSDPRLGQVLLSLGNALRKSSPGEAEQIYKEAIELHMGKLQYQSAAAAITNLGLLYTELGRHREALEHYERALRIRVQTPGVKPAQLALILNNMANSLKSSGNLPDAIKVIDRAIKILPADDPQGASLFNTKGNICLDEGDFRDGERWISKGLAQLQKQHNLKPQRLAQHYEDLIRALDGQGSRKEGEKAREKLATIRKEIESIPKVDESLAKTIDSAEAAVMVELAFGTRPRRENLVRDINQLSERLSKCVSGLDVGRYSSWLALPETITLIFYGADGDRLGAAVEPAVTGEPLCAGARIIVQQNGKQREIGVANSSLRVN